MPAPGPILAAGAVVTRKALVKGRERTEVLLVHRPKYDDWSFPKGKVDPDEHPAAAAVREVAEETGLDIRLGPPLPAQSYLVVNGNGRKRTKQVRYWVGRAVGGDDVGEYAANDEIDQVRWFPMRQATRRLTYERDLETLAQAAALRKKSSPLVVLRHGKARSRDGWHADDRERPLNRVGEFQSERLVPLLAAYGVTRLVSSSSRRCWTTLSPYADVTGNDLEVTDALSEEDATEASVARIVRALSAGGEPAVLCGHRPVLPHIFAALGVAPPALDPAAMAVVHHRERRILAVEVHGSPTAR